MKFLISKETRALVVLTALCIGLFGFRWLRTQEVLGVGMVWNLFLAWVPLFFALVARRMTSRKFWKYTSIAMWLLFFPNAPYIITDLVHLDHLPRHIWWYDSLGIFVAAFTGLLLGIYSLSIVHQLWKNSFGSFMAWFGVLVSTLLCGFGIYLGRFLRFNSWDIISNPLSLAYECLGSLTNPLAMKTTVLFGVVLMAIYIAYHHLTHSEHELQKTA